MESDEGGDARKWFRVKVKTTTEEEVWVRATSRTSAAWHVKEGGYLHGPFNPRHVRTTVASVSAPMDALPEWIEDEA